MTAIDQPDFNDNRNYDYNSTPVQDRAEYGYVVDMITDGSKVIDLGCGNGSLLQRLIQEKHVQGEGIELSSSGVGICQAKELRVTQGLIDQLLPYEENAFDFAICNVTIQMVERPEVLLREMKRIATHQIISFPNFAYFKNRIDLLWNGRMPKQMLFGYQWYNTGHVHQLSLKDMHDLIKDTGGLKITARSAVPVGYFLLDKLGEFMPNLFQKIIILKLEKSGDVSYKINHQERIV